MNAYSAALPGYTIVPISADDIIPAGGSIGFCTRLRPAGKLKKVPPKPKYLCGGNFTCQGDCEY